MKINLGNIVCLVFFLTIYQSALSQKVDDDETIRKMKNVIKEFFIKNGEITIENRLDIGAYEIIDGTELGYKNKGIYIIRTVYSTNGTDYLLFKNGKDFFILDFEDLKLIIDKSLNLLNDKPDKEIFDYLKAIIKWYEDSHLYFKNTGELKRIKK
ncbi:hypothetical protein [Flavobacterium ajazii]|uniref:hypothetical protein n=1 Tax=Flavobacterium ajazii TaxID=2692318 RepID=UPI0013D284DB|nr:hypothetical protein [Flavobacterium ajazii]